MMIIVTDVIKMRRNLKEKNVQVLRELLKDSSQSDRVIAKKVGISQPTISRLKKSLIESGAILSFSAIPNFSKMGFKLMALTFVKLKYNFSDIETHDEGHLTAQEWFSKQPNVIFSEYCRGMGMNGLAISLHYSYHDFEGYIKKHNKEIGHNVSELETVLVDLSSDDRVKAFDFSGLAEMKPPNE